MSGEIERLSNAEALGALRRFERLVEKRLAPSVGTDSPLQIEVFWPKPPLKARCIPDGVMSLDEDDGYDYVQRLEAFMARHGGQQVVFWAIGGERNGVYWGEYSQAVRLWLKSELVLSPTIILSRSEDVFLISDEQLHFTVVGANSSAIADLECAFGGTRVLEQNFIKWADCGLAGFDGDRRGWAYAHLIPWCDWNHGP
jgi:hypothetical protein